MHGQRNIKHKNLVFCFASKHEYLSNDLPVTVKDSFTNLSVVNFCTIMSSYQLTNAFSGLIIVFICVTHSDSLRILFSLLYFEFRLSKCRPDNKVKTIIKSVTKYMQ